MKQYIKHIIGWGGTFIVVAGIGAWLVDAFNSLTDNKYPKLAWIIYVILILLLASYIYLRKIKEKNSEQYTTPQVVLLPIPGQLRLNNNGDKNVYLLGTKFADTTADLVDEERIIPSKHYYYFPTDALAINAIQKIGMNGSELVPFIVYIRDHLGDVYEARFGLRINVKQGNVEIHTQQLGLQKVNSTNYELYGSLRCNAIYKISKLATSIDAKI